MPPTRRVKGNIEGANTPKKRKQVLKVNSWECAWLMV